MLLLAMASQQPWAAGARGAAKSALAPVEGAMTSLAAQVDRLTSVFGDVSSLRAENQRLRAADEQLRRQIVELNAAAKENASLRQALNFQKASGHRLVAAQVIGRGPDSFSRTMQIDRGTADGVQPGMVVATGADVDPIWRRRRVVLYAPSPAVSGTYAEFATASVAAVVAMLSAAVLTVAFSRTAFVTATPYEIRPSGSARRIGR